MKASCTDLSLVWFAGATDEILFVCNFPVVPSRPHCFIISMESTLPRYVSGAFRVYVAFWVFFRVQQRKQLVLQCFEEASNVSDGTSQTHKMLAFAVFTVGSCESPGKYSQVPKRVVSKRVVLADVPPYRHFIFLTFWFFYVLAVRRCLSPQRGETQTKGSP